MSKDMFDTSKIDLKRVFIAFLVLAVAVPFLTFAGHSNQTARHAAALLLLLYWCVGRRRQR